MLQYTLQDSDSFLRDQLVTNVWSESAMVQSLKQ